MDLKNLPQQSLAVFVKRRRKEIGLTQRALAEQLGMNYDFIRRLEQGETNLTLSRVNQVLRFFGFHLLPAPLPGRANGER